MPDLLYSYKLVRVLKSVSEALFSGLPSLEIWLGGIGQGLLNVFALIVK